MNKQIYDVAIIGGGPAGYSAALYCAKRIIQALRKASTALTLEKRCSSRQNALAQKPFMPVLKVRI